MRIELFSGHQWVLIQGFAGKSFDHGDGVG
jgi:hypothetical protein